MRIVLVWPHTHTAGSEDTRAVIHTPSCRRCFPQGISWVTFISAFEFYGIQAFCNCAAVKKRNLQQELQFAVSSLASRHVSVYPCCLPWEVYLNPLKQGPYSPNYLIFEVLNIWVTSLCNQQTGAGAGAAPGFIIVVSFKMQHSNYVEYVSIS